MSLCILQCTFRLLSFFSGSTEFPGTQGPCCMMPLLARSLKSGDSCYFSSARLCVPGFFLCSHRLNRMLFMRGPWGLDCRGSHHVDGQCAHWQIDPSRVPGAELHFALLLREDLGRAVCLMCRRVVLRRAPRARGTSVRRLLEDGSEQWVLLACVCRMSSCCLPLALP